MTQRVTHHGPNMISAFAKKDKQENQTNNKQFQILRSSCDVCVCFGTQIVFATACLLLVILKFQREQRLEEQVGNSVKIIFSLFQSTYLIKNIMNLSIILSGHEQ